MTEGITDRELFLSHGSTDITVAVCTEEAVYRAGVPREVVYRAGVSRDAVPGHPPRVPGHPPRAPQRSPRAPQPSPCGKCSRLHAETEAFLEQKQRHFSSRNTVKSPLLSLFPVFLTIRH